MTEANRTRLTSLPGVQGGRHLDAIADDLLVPGIHQQPSDRGGQRKIRQPLYGHFIYRGPAYYDRFICSLGVHNLSSVQRHRRLGEHISSRDGVCYR